MSVAGSDLAGLLFLWIFSTTQPGAHWLFEKCRVLGRSAGALHSLAAGVP